jgi:hypothetical protein
MTGLWEAANSNWYHTAGDLETTRETARCFQSRCFFEKRSSLRRFQGHLARGRYSDLEIFGEIISQHGAVSLIGRLDDNRVLAIADLEDAFRISAQELDFSRGLKLRIV